jgi:replication-associated recombination protein RarA
MEVIGQDKIKKVLYNKVNHFIVLIGQKGQGKTTLAKYITDITGSIYYELENPKVDEIREVINKSYRLTQKELYFIKGNLSKRVENSLLKIIEEPPNLAYFIISTVETSRLLPTILSRAQTLVLEPYTKEHLQQVADNKLILEVANNIGQVKELEEINVNKLYEICDKIVNNVKEVSAANIFNIVNHLEDFTENLNLIFLMLYHIYEEELKKGENVYKELLVLNHYQSLINKGIVDKVKSLEFMFLELRG